MRNKSTLLLDGRRGLLMNSRRRFSLRILELNRPFMMLSSMTSPVLKLLAGCSSNRFRSLNFFFIAALKWLEGECSSQTYSLQISSYCIHLALAHQALSLPCWWLFQWWDPRALLKRAGHWNFHQILLWLVLSSPRIFQVKIT